MAGTDPQASRCRSLGPRIVWFVALAAGGALVALYSAAEAYRIRTEGLIGTSLCSVTSWLDCRAALASRHAFLFGIPVSWYAFLLYLWCVIVGAAALVSTRYRPGVWRAAFPVCLAMVVMSAYEAFVLVTRIRVLCPTCLVLYAVNVLLLVFAVRGLGLRLRALDAWAARTARRAWAFGVGAFAPGRAWVLLAALPVVVAAGVVGLGVWTRSGFSEIEILQLDFLDRFYRQPIARLQLPEDVPQRGDPGAPVRIVVFSDFQCAFCARLYEVTEPYREHLRFAFLHFPFDASVNPYGHIPGREVGALAARAAVLANAHGRFWELHDHLFANQRRLDRGLIETWLRRSGFDEADIQPALEGPETAARVRRDVELGYRLGVPGTPTIYVNGRRMAGYGPDLLDLVLRHELRRAGREMDTRPDRPLPSPRPPDRE